MGFSFPVIKRNLSLPFSPSLSLSLHPDSMSNFFKYFVYDTRYNYIIVSIASITLFSLTA